MRGSCTGQVTVTPDRSAGDADGELTGSEGH